MKYTCYQIHAVKCGSYLEKKAYKFIAEFSDKDMAFEYLKQLRTTKDYASMDLILTKDMCTKRRISRKTLEIITILGEQLPVWTMEID